MIIDRDQVFVRALRPDGTWGSVDVLDLDEESFRRWIVGTITKQQGQEEPRPLRQRRPSDELSDLQY